MTNELEERFSGFNRMFISKPIMHFYKSAENEVEGQPCKKKKLSIEE